MSPIIEEMRNVKDDVASVLSDTLHLLKGKGYVLECRREATCLYCFEWHQYIFPTQFHVDSTHYFKHADNPDEDRIVYAISLSQGGKGYLIDTCNVYVDNISQAMMQKLRLVIRSASETRQLLPGKPEPKFFESSFY